MNKKEIMLLDFGNVLATHRMESWFITPNFWNIIDKDQIDLEKFYQAMKKYNYYLSLRMTNEQEEFKCFSKFYASVFEEINYYITLRQLVAITSDWTFNDDKFLFYDNIKKELQHLCERYRLILLSDNWPSAERIMKNYDIYNKFIKIYISSVYGCEKRDGKFFDFPINEYDLKGNIFVDDNINNLEIAREKGLEPVLMDRTERNKDAKVKRITSLFDL
ncbi:MAG TPA: hypothetical protein PLV83_05190 [Bacilli bacterium]|nr:hypothetical protein [Bacilli bacterium]